MTRDECIASCVGWLEGFSTTVWALLSTNDGAKLVDASAGEDYDLRIKKLRDALYAERPTIGDFGPYTVKTVPLSGAPVDLTPKITFKAGEIE